MKTSINHPGGSKASNTYSKDKTTLGDKDCMKGTRTTFPMLTDSVMDAGTIFPLLNDSLKETKLVLKRPQTSLEVES